MGRGWQVGGRVCILLGVAYMLSSHDGHITSRRILSTFDTRLLVSCSSIFKVFWLKILHLDKVCDGLVDDWFD